MNSSFNIPPIDLSISKDWYKRSEREFKQRFNPDYQGPTDESNWLIPGILLVGAYPSSSSKNPLESTKIQRQLLSVGIDTFVCLHP